MNKIIYALAIAVLVLFSTSAFSQGLPSAKLIASDSARDALFGNSVAISGDTAVVGSWARRFGAKPAQGAIYVFVRKGDVWVEQSKLTAADGSIKDYFGQRVGISGDTIVVGAPGTDNDLTNNYRQAHGAAYIFTRTNNVWSQKQKLTGDNPASVAFGVNVAIDNKTVVVSNGSDAASYCAVYVFTDNGTGWKQDAKIFTLRNSPEQLTGGFVTHNLALDGNTFVVGGTHKGGKSDGAVYVYVRNLGKWARQAKLTPSDGVKADNFGWTVGINDNTVIVGAWGMANGMRGAAYVFERKNALTTPVWVEQNRLTMNDGSIGDRFGCAVGITNDTIIIGSDNRDLKAQNWNEGAAYIFNYTPSKPS